MKQCIKIGTIYRYLSPLTLVLHNCSRNFSKLYEVWKLCDCLLSSSLVCGGGVFEKNFMLHLCTTNTYPRLRGARLASPAACPWVAGSGAAPAYQGAVPPCLRHTPRMVCRPAFYLRTLLRPYLIGWLGGGRGVVFVLRCANSGVRICPPMLPRGASPRSAPAFFSAWVIFSSYISLLHIIIISRNTASAYCVVILGIIIFRFSFC